MKKVMFVVLIMVFMLAMATAAFAAPEKIHVCHANSIGTVSSGAAAYTLIYISDNAYDTHTDHSDYAARVEDGDWTCLMP